MALPLFSFFDDCLKPIYEQVFTVDMDRVDVFSGPLGISNRSYFRVLYISVYKQREKRKRMDSASCKLSVLYAAFVGPLTAFVSLGAFRP